MMNPAVPASLDTCGTVGSRCVKRNLAREQQPTAAVAGRIIRESGEIRRQGARCLEIKQRAARNPLQWKDKPLRRQDREIASRDHVQGLRGNSEMLGDKFRRKVRDPLVERKVLVNRRSEHLQEHQIFIARVST